MSPRLPGWIARIVSRLFGTEAAEGILGDLAEASGRVHDRKGAVAARFWLVRQLGSLLRSGLAHRRPLLPARMTRPLRDLSSDLRQSGRMIRKSPAVVLAAVLTLSLGIGAGTTFFSITNAVLWRALPYPNSERLVSIGSTPPEDEWAGRVFSISPALYRAWKENLTSFEALTGTIAGENVDMTGEGEPERYRGAWVDFDFARVFGVTPRPGRWFTAEEDVPGSPPVMLISDAMWRTRFGADPGVVGRSFTVNEAPRTVIGVLPAGLALPEELDLERIDALMPIGQSGRNLLESDNWYVRVVGLLRADVSPALAYEELERVTHSILETTSGTAGGRDEFVPGFAFLKQLTMRPQGNALIAMFGASLLLVLIACSNVAHLLLARASARTREFSVRAALGAGRARLIRQLLTESLTLGLLGGGGGYVLATFGVRLFRSINPGGIPRIEEVVVDSTVLWAALLAAVVTGIGFGLVPAFQATGRDIVTGLKAGGRGSEGAGARVRNALVAGEVGLAVIMVAAAALLLNSYFRILNVDPGFDPEGVSDVRIAARSRYGAGPQRRQFIADIVARVAAIPGAEHVAVTAGRPFGGPNVAGSFTIEGGTNSDEARDYLPFQQIGAGYLELLGARLVPGGRFMSTAEVTDGARVAVVNRAFERRFLDGESALGRRVRLGDPQDDDPYFAVVGVIEDMAPGRLTRESPPTLYVPNTLPDLYVFTEFAVAVRSDLPPAQLASQLRAAVWTIDPDQVISSIATLDERIRESLTAPIFFLVLFGSFGVIALVLAAVGTYGTVSYGIAQRKLEMGIRLALGATAARVFRLVVRQGMIPVVIGLVAGTGAALGLSRFVEALVYGVSPTDTFTYAVGGGVLLVVALLACVIPARGASRADPMGALRAE